MDAAVRREVVAVLREVLPKEIARLGMRKRRRIERFSKLKLPPSPELELVEKIQKQLCADHGISLRVLLSPRRTAPVVRVRQLGMHLAYYLTTLSMPEVATAFRRKNHTTVLHALGQVADLVKKDKDVEKKVAAYTKLFQPRNGFKRSR